MKELKRSLKICGILCLIFAGFDILGLFLDIFYVEKVSWVNITLDSIEIVLSILTGVVFLCVRNKDKSFFLKNSGLFLGLTIVNIFNGFVVWVLSFWVYIIANRVNRFEIYVNRFGQDAESNFSNEKQRRPEDIELSEEDYEIKTIKETLTQKLQELEDLKEKGLITDEEYKKLRQEAIDNYI